MIDQGYWDRMSKLISRLEGALYRTACMKLTSDRYAVTALEYGIIASILGLVLVGIFTSFGKTLSTLFSHVASSI
jgi:Flp pilus assembly pilin Flp